MTLDAATEQTKMPNHYKFVAKAGTALLFDTASWHTAMPCLPGSPDRRAVIMGWNAARDCGEAATLSAAHVEELTAMGRMTPTLARLIGLS
jgi:hypothetical protein